MADRSAGHPVDVCTNVDISPAVRSCSRRSSLELSRDLDIQYKTAFVMAHKLREAMAAEDKGAKVSGKVEIDGMYVGG